MTLSKQLYALILLVSLLMGAGTLYISIENARSYQISEVAMQTKNTTDSLGISLTPFMAVQDIAAMDTLVNAAFDGGYYQSLTLTSMQNQILVQRKNTSKIDGVPQWFIRTISFPPTIVEATLMSGWNQAGVLRLEANPGIAYKKLWSASKDVVGWALLVMVISFTIAAQILRVILQPLDQVEHQAHQICNREFSVVQNIPKTRELRKIVLAMNALSEKVESMVTKLTIRAESAREQTYHDELTGLINRKRFLSIIQHTISAKNRELGAYGHIAIVRINNFSDYNIQEGQLDGENLLINLANTLTQICNSHEHFTTGRLSNEDFAILMPVTTAESTMAFANILSENLYSYNNTLPINNQITAGIAAYNAQSTVTQLMADVDAALASAQHQGITYVILENHSDAMGNVAWKKLIKECITDQRISFSSQAVFSKQHQIVFEEILMNITHNSNHKISTASFAAMAERLELNFDLDEYVITKALQHLHQKPSSPPISVNISAHSLKSTHFSFWLQNILNKYASVASKLYFEITEHGASQDLIATTYFIELIHRFGGKVVLEHFGSRSCSFQTLKQLKADFIKVDGAYINDITRNSEQASFLQSVIDFAHGLEIQVIIEHIESHDESEFFYRKGVDALQGIYFSEPKPLS